VRLRRGDAVLRGIDAMRHHGFAPGQDQAGE
jgi:hypothetical protein